MGKIILALVGFLIFGSCFIYLILPMLALGLLFSALESADKSIRSR